MHAYHYVYITCNIYIDKYLRKVIDPPEVKETINGHPVVKYLLGMHKLLCAVALGLCISYGPYQWEQPVTDHPSHYNYTFGGKELLK